MISLRFIFVLLPLILATACTSLRQDAVRGALDRGEYTRAISYMQGLSREEKREVTLKWCEATEEAIQPVASANDQETAVLKDDEAAQQAGNLAYCYETGLGGFPKSGPGALTWYRAAVRLGDPSAKIGIARVQDELVTEEKRDYDLASKGSQK